jgi:hypothetical protein
MKYEGGTRERRENGRESYEGHYILLGGKRKLPALKIPSQCSFVFLIQICLRKGKALGSEA